MKGFVLLLLCVGFALLFLEGRLAIYAREFYAKSRLELDAAARQRNLENRKRRILGADHSFWSRLEQTLYYNGIKLKFPYITVELWLAMHLVIGALGLLVGGMFFPLTDMVLTIFACFLLERFLLQRVRAKNLRLVNEEMPKLLDFLGNYSITSGEITGVFLQVARYLRNPLSKVLESCYYEAQTTGDSRAALLAMRDKIEHPKFKELVTNIEVNLRYCADFSVVMAGAKRSMREHLKNTGERSGMLREAVISMVLLAGMALMVLWIVGGMVNMSVPAMMLGTLPGKIGLAGVGIIVLLFYRQTMGVHE